MIWWQYVLVVLFGVPALWLAKRGIKERERLQAEATARREEAQRQLRERGELLPNGRLACLVCLKAEATDYYPKIARSRLDRDPLGHRALYHQTPMYVLEDDHDSGEALCAPHKRMLVRKIEQKLSEIRTRTANLNAQIEEELAAFETVELITWARLEAERAAFAVQQVLSKSSDKLLPSPSQPPNPNHPGVTVKLVPTEGEESSE